MPVVKALLEYSLFKKYNGFFIINQFKTIQKPTEKEKGKINSIKADSIFLYFIRLKINWMTNNKIKAIIAGTDSYLDQKENDMKNEAWRKSSWFIL